MKTPIPIGRFTRKIQFQAKAFVSTPPSRTPRVPPPETTKPNTPIAFARSAGSVKSLISSASAIAETMAPPTPCTARATISQASEFARPQASEASVKSVTPARKMRRQPKRSPSAPAEQHEAAERQQVGVRDPGERLRAEAQVVLDRRQRDVHDRHVEHDHQIADAHDDEGDPAAATGELHPSPTLATPADVPQRCASAFRFCVGRAPATLARRSRRGRPGRSRASPSRAASAARARCRRGRSRRGSCCRPGRAAATRAPGATGRTRRRAPRSSRARAPSRRGRAAPRVSATRRSRCARSPRPEPTGRRTDRYTAAMSANHVKTSEAGSSTTVPTTVAATSVLQPGCTLPAIAQA